MSVNRVTSSAVSIDRIKRTAKLIKREKGIPHHEALNEAAVLHGFRNFKHAQNHDGSPLPTLKKATSHYAYISASWNGIGAGSVQRGTFAIRVELSAKLSDLVGPQHLINHRALARFSLIGDNHLEHTMTITNSPDPIDDAQVYICAAARALLFIDATGLKPSSASYSKLDTLPGKDHRSAWYYPALKAHIYVDEPYRDRVERDLSNRDNWASSHGFAIELSGWDGMYNPAGGACLFLVGKSEHSELIRTMNNKLASIPKTVVPEKWGEWSDDRVQIVSPLDVRKTLEINRTDVIKVARGKSLAASGQTVKVNHLLFAGHIKRPNAKMPINAHGQVGMLLKEVLVSTADRAGVYNKLNKARSVLDDWAQLEYDHSELSDEAFFSLYYREGESSGKRTLSAEEGLQLERKLDAASAILREHYPSCKPLDALLKNIDGAIASLRTWCGYENSAIATSSENEAYSNGFNAQTDGASQRDNPYPRGSNEFELWASGWQDGADADFEEDMNRD